MVLSCHFPRPDSEFPWEWPGEKSGDLDDLLREKMSPNGASAAQKTITGASRQRELTRIYIAGLLQFDVRKKNKWHKAFVVTPHMGLFQAENPLP